jgi:hypothetical protein
MRFPGSLTARAAALAGPGHDVKLLPELQKRKAVTGLLQPSFFYVVLEELQARNFSPFSGPILDLDLYYLAKDIY